MLVSFFDIFFILGLYWFSQEYCSTFQRLKFIGRAANSWNSSRLETYAFLNGTNVNCGTSKWGWQLTNVSCLSSAVKTNKQCLYWVDFFSKTQAFTEIPIPLHSAPYSDLFITLILWLLQWRFQNLEIWKDTTSFTGNRNRIFTTIIVFSSDLRAIKTHVCNFFIEFFQTFWCWRLCTLLKKTVLRQTFFSWKHVKKDFSTTHHDFELHRV